jgi:hypothetical protein
VRYFWILVALASAWLLGSNALVPKKASWHPANLYPSFSLPDLLSVEVALPASGKDEAWVGNLTHSSGTWVLSRKKERWVMRQEQLDEFFRAIILAPLPDPQAAIDPSRAASEFGLAPPHAQLTLRAKDGETPTLNVGDPLPGGQGYFVRNGETGRIEWVPVNFAPLLAHRLESLEDSRGLFVDPESITSFQINNRADNTTIEAHREEGAEGKPSHWDLYTQSPKLINRPVQRGMPQKVMGYLMGWHNLIGIRVPARPAPKKPLFIFQFETKQHPTPFTLEVAADREKGHYLLSRLDTNETFSCLFPRAATSPQPADFLDDHLLSSSLKR